MSGFMGNHIGFRKPAGTRVGAGAEFALHVFEERSIEVNALIARAIKRAHGRAGEGAGRGLGAREQPQFRRMVSPPAGGKDLGPTLLYCTDPNRPKFTPTPVPLPPIPRPR